MIIWDERLITRQRAADMCGTWDLKIDFPYLRCSLCDGNVTKLPSAGMLLNADVLISAVVRHMCMSHDYNLSGVSNEGRDASADYSARDGGGGNRTADTVR